MGFGALHHIGADEARFAVVRTEKCEGSCTHARHLHLIQICCQGKESFIVRGASKKNVKRKVISAPV